MDSSPPFLLRHVPAGLVIPMMVIGGAYGRLMGLGVLEAKKSMCAAAYADATDGGDVGDAYYWSTVYRWVMSEDCHLPDPGTYRVELAHTQRTPKS